MDDGTKACTRCGKTKSLSEFYRSNTTRAGYRSTCKECQRATQKLRSRTAYNVQHYAALRRQVLAAYGGRCACCGEDRFEFLAVDHENGGGNQHRRQVGGGAKFLRWLRDNNYPVGYRVLCHNCNLSRGFYGYCPCGVDAESLAEIRKPRLTDPRVTIRSSPKLCPICGREFVRPPSARAITCSYECDETRRALLGDPQFANKLTEEQRSDIRRRRAAGETPEALALEFGVTVSAIDYHVGRASSTAAAGVPSSTVRLWARQNGHSVSDKGRIPRALVVAYVAASANPVAV